MIYKHDVIEQREAIQNDVLSILEGIEDEVVLDAVCDVIVERMQILIDKLEG